MAQLSKIASSTRVGWQQAHIEDPLVLPNPAAVQGKLDSQPSIESLNKELGLELKRLQRNLGSDPCQIRDRVYSLTDVSMIDRLFEKQRSLGLSLLGEPDSRTLREDLSKNEHALRSLATDRISRLKRLNDGFETGAIDLKELDKLRRTGNAKAFRENMREIFDFIERSPDLAYTRFARPHEDFLQSGVIRYPQTPPPGAPLTSAALREKPQKLNDTIAAVQSEYQLLSSQFPDRKVFLDIVSHIGPQSIQNRLNDISASNYLLPRLIKPEDRAASNPRAPYETKLLTAEHQVRALSIDFLERSAAFREVMAHPESRVRLLQDLTPQNRVAYERAVQSGTRSEAAEKYHQATRRVIAILNSSPDQIQRTIDVSPLETPARPLIPATQKDSNRGPRGALEPSRTASGQLAGTVIAAPPEVSSTATALPLADGIRGRLRAIAESRSHSAFHDLVQITLLSRIDPNNPNTGSELNQRLLSAISRRNIQTHDLTGDVPAHQFAQATNRRLQELAQPDSPLFQITSQRVELEKKKSQLLGSALGGVQLETALLALRTEHTEAIGKTLKTHFPTLKPEDLNIAESLLPKSEIRRLVDLKAMADRATVEEHLRKQDPPANLNLPPKIQPKRQEEGNAPAQPMEPVRHEVKTSAQLNTANRQAIQGLQFTETSLIQVHGTVNGRSLFVSYDPVKQRIVSDPGMAEEIGIRFVDSGEKGPNGLPKISVQFTLPGEFSVDYRGINLRSAARWQGNLAARTSPEVNRLRMSETRAGGDDTWLNSIPSGARAADGSPIQYAFSKEENRLFAKSRDGKSFFAFDAEKNCWHNIAAQNLPIALRPAKAEVL